MSGDQMSRDQMRTTHKKHSRGHNMLNYNEFLELSTNIQPTGLGLHFEEGEAETLFKKVDKNNDGNISLDELLTYFTKSHDDEDGGVMPAKKRIALVAHDKFKGQMVS